MADEDSVSSPHSFDLIASPWILVRGLDGQVEERSILDALRLAHSTADIVGEIPTQSFAITRMLLAILHRSVEGPRSLDHWAQLWARPHLDMKPIEAYLSSHEGRFDLLSTVMPFYQVADLHTSRSEVFGLERIIADAPTGKPFLTTRLRPAIESISLAEASRWLVHCQAYDASGIKSGAVGDPRVKGGRGYPIGPGWCGNLGGILIRGSNLHETLLLNLIAESRSYLPTSRNDLPIWEQGVQSSTESVAGGRVPYGPLDLYTWQSRRIRLHAADGRVTGVLVANGDKLNPQNMHQLEPMTAWRRSTAQEKKLRQSLVYMPRLHDPERTLWRGLSALLPRAVAGSVDSAPRPGLVDWVAELRSADLLPADYRLSLRAYGLHYINQQSVVGDLVDDELSLAVAVLSASSLELASHIDAAVTSCEHAARSLGDLAGALAQAAGGEADGPKARALETAFAVLDAPFRSWLTTLGAGTLIADSRAEWSATARGLILRLGEELTETAGLRAWIGRQVQGDLRCTPVADARFRRDMFTIFPPPEPRPRIQPPPLVEAQQGVPDDIV